MNCVVCQTPMMTVDPADPAVAHPNCQAFGEPYNEDPFSHMLKQKMIDIIRWADQQNPRGQQVLIGPSEIGDLCDRRIAYRIAQVPASNVGVDTWPAIVGTAVHSWLQDAVDGWMVANWSKDWMTETTLHVSEFVEGHSDLYWVSEQCVIDHKTASPAMFKKTKEEGPAPGYVIQAHIYGYGFEQAGYPVKKVALTFFNRAGWLKDMYVWSADYDRSIAEGALARLYQIARQVVDLDVLNQSHRWEQIEAYPSNSCGFCRWYSPWKDADIGADHQGCPGR